jgi:hypothetical protein
VALDSAGPIPGYFDSPWPAECGGPRRQRVPRSAGLGIGQSTELRQHSRANGQWNVLAVLRAPGEVYLLYTNQIASPEKYGQVELIDAANLETVRRSPRLPTGGHTWCTALVAHENGYLYATSGNYCVKLDPDCAVVAEAVLPQDSAYNGLLIAADGRLIMKNIERDADRLTTLVVLDPDRLEQVAEETPVPENSMGRIAMDTTPDGQQYVYVPGSHHFYRFAYQPEAGALVSDPRWQPRYRTAPDDVQGFTWDSCLAGGGCWFLDNGDNEANTVIFGTRPFGQHVPPRASAFRGLASSPQKLIRVALDDDSDIRICAPFGAPRGVVFSPPAYDPVRRIAIAFDTGNGLLGGVRYHEDGSFEPLWRQPCRISMQMMLFPDTGEIAVNDFRDGRDHVVFFDVESGRELGRAMTESRVANGMFLSPGWDRDVIYCSTGAIARVWSED